MLSDAEILRHYRETGALLEGHFILSSGLRSSAYLQSAKVMAEPWRAEILCRALADRIRGELGDGAIDLVVSPAMGGVVVGYEMGRQLSVPAIFTERVEGEFALRRGFEIPPGSRVLMAEDIITTGKSSLECIACITDHGGQVVAASCLLDRSDGTADLGVPFFALMPFAAPVYAPDDLPAELAGIPPVKPGSRGLK